MSTALSSSPLRSVTAASGVTIGQQSVFHHHQGLLSAGAESESLGGVSVSSGASTADVKPDNGGGSTIVGTLVVREDPQPIRCQGSEKCADVYKKFC